MRVGFSVVGACSVQVLLSDNNFSLWYLLLFLVITLNTNQISVILETLLLFYAGPE
jgi:hypothetical protein